MRGGPADKHVAVRFDAAMLTRIDGIVGALTTPWHRATRSDAIRALVVEALPILEARHPQPAPAPKPARKRGPR